MWYTVKEIMLILQVERNKAYQVMRALGEEIARKKIPGTNTYFSKPPAGRIQKKFFCEKYMLDVQECDEFIRNQKGA